MIRISSRDAVKDTIEYWDKAKNKDFSKYWRKLKKNKKKNKKTSNYIPNNKSNVPNPLRKNYDYSTEMGGPEWQNRVKTYMKKIKNRAKKRKK